MTSTMTSSVFVYGTLKQGQCRQHYWPVQPAGIQVGWVRGSLYGRADYPAMTAGQDRVLGELWRFDAGDIDRVLRTLDRVEGTNQDGLPDLYHRVSIEAWDLDNHSCGLAWTYLYATDPVQDGFVRIEAVGPVRWPA